MLGYIAVVDTPYFALTDRQGVVKLEGLPDGTYSNRVWTPRLRPARLPPGIDIELAANTSRQIVVQLTNKFYGTIPLAPFCFGAVGPSTIAKAVSGADWIFHRYLYVVRTEL